MDAEEFIKIAADKLPRLVLLLGEEEYYSRLVIKHLREQWLSPDNAAELTVLTEDPPPPALQEILLTPSFFSPRSLILIRQSKLLTASLTDKELSDYLAVIQAVPEHCLLVIQNDKTDKRLKFYKAAARSAQIVECPRLAPGKSKKDLYTIKTWLNQAAADKGCRWEAAALNFILEYLAMTDDFSLAFLAQEVEKISLYAGERRLWLKTDAQQLLCEPAGLSGFALLDALVARDACKAMVILKEFTARGDPLPKILGLLAWQLRNLLAVKTALDKGQGREEILSAAKMSPFLLDRFSGFCARLSARQIQQALGGVAEITREIPFGGRGLERLEEIIIQFCR